MELISSSGILDVTHSYCMLLLYPSTLCQDGPSYPRGRTIGCSGMRHELDPPLLRSDVRPPLNLSQTWSGHQVHSVPVNVPLIEFWKQWEWKGIYRRVIISYLGVVRKNSNFTLKNLDLANKKEPNKSVVPGCPPVNWLVFFVFVCHIVQWLVCEIHIIPLKY